MPQQVSVYMRFVQFVVVVPAHFVWAFMEEFGREFAREDSYESSEKKFNRAVDGYREHPNGWHITVSVSEMEATRLMDFIKDFAFAHGADFKE